VVLFAADDKNPPPNQPPPPQATDQDKDKDNLAKGDEHSKGPKEENLTYRQRMVFGTVKDVKDIDVTAEGKTENHMLAKLETQDKQLIVVDLGPRGGLKSEVKAGDEIAAFGIAGRLRQKPLIVASKIATIVPIEGREPIFESVPASFTTEQGKESGANINTNTTERFAQDERRSDKGSSFSQEQVRGTTEQNGNSNAQFSQEAIRRSNEGQFNPSANYAPPQPANYGPQGTRSDCCECQNR